MISDYVTDALLFIVGSLLWGVFAVIVLTEISLEGVKYVFVRAKRAMRQCLHRFPDVFDHPVDRLVLIARIWGLAIICTLAFIIAILLLTVDPVSGIGAMIGSLVAIALLLMFEDALPND